MLDRHTVRERADVQLVQQSSLTGQHPLTLQNQRHGVDDFDLRLVNLRGDVEGLEEGGLTGIATSGTSGHDDIDVSDDTDTSGSGHLVVEDGLTDGGHVSVDEDQTDVSVHHINQLLDGVTGVLLDELSHAAAHHGLLTEEEDGLTAEGLTDISDLLGGHVLDLDDEDLGVVLEDLVEVLEVESLLFSSRHNSLHSVEID